jgi:hypothetical protein
MASNEEFKIYSEIEMRHTTTMVQEINSNGLRLISKKEKIVIEDQGSEEKPKKTIISHTRSMINKPSGCGGILPQYDNSDREVTIQETFEGTSSTSEVQETQMTPEELETFELEWRDFWKPQFNPQFE